MRRKMKLLQKGQAVSVAVWVEMTAGCAGVGFLEQQGCKDVHRGTQQCHSCLHLQKQLVGQQPVSLHWEPPFALLAGWNKLRKLPPACLAEHPSKNWPMLGSSETSECPDPAFSVTETRCHRDEGRKIVKMSLRRTVRLYLIWPNDIVGFVVLVVSKPQNSSFPAGNKSVQITWTVPAVGLCRIWGYSC